MGDEAGWGLIYKEDHEEDIEQDDGSKKKNDHFRRNAAEETRRRREAARGRHLVLRREVYSHAVEARGRCWRREMLLGPRRRAKEGCAHSGLEVPDRCGILFR